MLMVVAVVVEASAFTPSSELADALASVLEVVVVPSSSVTETSVLVVDSELTEQPRVPSTSMQARPADTTTLLLGLNIRSPLIGSRQMHKM